MSIRFKFPHIEEVGIPPDESRLPAMPELDADRAVAAEIAVERGIATPEQEEYVSESEAFQPYLHDTGDTDEVEVPDAQAAPGKAAVYFTDTDKRAPDIANEVGSFTWLESARPDPRDEGQDR
jgi:hypothetical protein